MSAMAAIRWCCTPTGFHSHITATTQHHQHHALQKADFVVKRVGGGKTTFCLRMVQWCSNEPEEAPA